MAEFRLARAAERDLERITEFVARENLDAALRVLDELERTFFELAARPGIGHRRADLTPEGFRFWSVFDLLVVYDPESRPLAILRVLHGRRDVERELTSWLDRPSRD